ncbi:MAG: succinate dehydrogenase assembly factor 2 [Pseudomonadota bacterium]
MSENEKLENVKKRLIFRSWHRGTREMDLILGSFANTHVEGFTEEELALYDELLQNSDPDLYNWISGREELPDDKRDAVMEKVLAHHYATNRKSGSDDR